MLAGMDDSHDFHEKKEACIRKHYDADEVELTGTKTVKKCQLILGTYGKLSSDRQSLA